jgi:hypothetical protein
MKNLSDFAVYGILAFAILMAFWIVSRRERFGVPEFLDRTMEDRTAKSWSSSYAQTTNHLLPPDSHSPPQGGKTGHRVGLFQGYTDPPFLASKV